MSLHCCPECLRLWQAYQQAHAKRRGLVQQEHTEVVNNEVSKHEEFSDKLQAAEHELQGVEHEIAEHEAAAGRLRRAA